MQGKTHKALGVVAGASFVLASASAGDPLVGLALVTAPIGAMFPDIDHDNSKLGAKRKQLFSTTKLITYIAIIAVVLLSIFLTKNFAVAILFGLPTIVISTIAGHPAVKKHTNFFTKHRGIMHTLLIPALGMLGNTIVSTKILKYLITGFVVGYMSHLISDCCTKAGCPILWPVTKKNISFLPVRTGTAMEYVVAFILGGVTVCLGIMVGH